MSTKLTVLRLICEQEMLMMMAVLANTVMMMMNRIARHWIGWERIQTPPGGGSLTSGGMYTSPPLSVQFVHSVYCTVWVNVKFGWYKFNVQFGSKFNVQFG